MADGHVVDLHVANEILPEFEQTKHLLGGTEVGRETDPFRDVTVIKIAMPDAPENAAAMTPWFTRHEDGSATVHHIEYLDANGARIP